MSLSTTPTREGQEIALAAQQARDVLSSRHDITTLARELLQKRLDEQHAANVKARVEALDRVNGEFSTSSQTLSARHEKEKVEWEDAQFAMVQRFDVQRDAVPGSMSLIRVQMEEERMSHERLIASHKAKKLHDDKVSQEELRKIVEGFGQERESATTALSLAKSNPMWHSTAGKCTEAIQRANQNIVEAREKTQRKDNARQQLYVELMEKATTEWKLRNDALQSQLNGNASGFRHARVELEINFQRQFLEHSRCWESAQKRQAEELEQLENRRDSSLAAVYAVHDGTEAELTEERRKVDEWWQHLSHTTTVCLQQVDEDEALELRQIEGPGQVVGVEAEDSTLAHDTEEASGSIMDPLQEACSSDLGQAVAADGTISGGVGKIVVGSSSATHIDGPREAMPVASTADDTGTTWPNSASPSLLLVQSSFAPIPISIADWNLPAGDPAHSSADIHPIQFDPKDAGGSPDSGCSDFIEV